MREGIIHRLQALLKRLKSLAVENNGHLLEFKKDNRGTIKLWKLEDFGDVLTEDVQRMWKGGREIRRVASQPSASIGCHEDAGYERLVEHEHGPV